ncbi:hypothetical protein Vi05172_g8126 [Venturia inaequalis]|nr:hypothetical protein Vi05172_g8126 [Venturia inaequalis]
MEPTYSPGEPLPARVSDACQRCRRNKSRCDTYRPCSLCKRANVECVPRQPDARHVRKKARIHGPESTPRPTQQSPRSSAIDGTEKANSSVAAQIPSPRSPNHPRYLTRAESMESISVVDYAEAESTMGITRKIFQLGNGRLATKTTSAIPDGNLSLDVPSPPKQQYRKAIASILGCNLPSMSIMKMLVEEYFASIHWFSLVIYEPKFRAQFSSIADGLADPSQKGFLFLLSIVLAMAAWYRSNRFEGESKDEWLNWKNALLANIESHMIELMDQTSLSAVQTFILAGSYYVYHGRPNLSLSLLGVTLRTAQAIGLHRDPQRGSFEDREERKRTWWTIYTWDRFASITYGRPLGINDDHCSVTMPEDVLESPHFIDSHDKNADTSICYSSYQRELNKLYVLASPFIEIIFGIRTSQSTSLAQRAKYHRLVSEVSIRIDRWKQTLPAHLAVEFNHDIALDSAMCVKVHRLQALALGLTFDSLVIILHRPFLAQQVDLLSHTSPSSIQQITTPTNLPPTTTNPGAPTTGDHVEIPHLPGVSSAEHWWNAAVRTSKITELPQLAQLATDSHLVAFLAINLFNCAVVMVVCALSDLLSNRAQEAKRYITRIYRLQEILGKCSTLPMQSSTVLRDLIRMLLQQEEAAMLASLGDYDHNSTSDAPLPTGPTAIRTVEDTLRIPLHGFGNVGNLTSEPDHMADHSGSSESLRLNESLVSVQRAVFPISRDGSEHQHSELGWTSLEPTADNPEGLDMSVHGFDVNQLQNPAYDEDGVSNPMYWIWENMNGPTNWP